MRQWFYQSCTEYGYWQNAYHDSTITVRSTLVNPAYHRGVCRRLFNLLDPAPVVAMNHKFYEPLLDPQMSSRVLFVNGARDPWSTLSINEINHNNTNALHSTFMIEEGSHCDDFSPDMTSDSESLKTARQLVLQKMKEWLKIY